MRKLPPKTKYQPPILRLPPFAVVYGTHEIVLGYTETREAADEQARLLNERAPQYNHRVKELSVGEQSPAALPPVRSRATRTGSVRSQDE